MLGEILTQGIHGCEALLIKDEAWWISPSGSCLKSCHAASFLKMLHRSDGTFRPVWVLDKPSTGVV